MPTTTSEQYQKIMRLKPIIEANQELVGRLKACFDYVEAYAENSRAAKPSEYVGGGSNRFVFGKFSPVQDPKTGDNEYFIIKIPMPQNPMGLSYRFEKLDALDFGLFGITRELDSLERYGGKNPFLSVLGVIIHHGHNNAGLLMSDYTKGGRYKILSH